MQPPFYSHLQPLQHEQQRVQQRQLARRRAALPAHHIHGAALAQGDACVHSAPLVPACGQAAEARRGRAARLRNWLQCAAAVLLLPRGLQREP